MKKLFTLLFLASCISPVFSAENVISSNEIRNEINKTVKTQIENDSNFAYFGNKSDSSDSLIKIIKFDLSVLGESRLYGDQSYDNNKNIPNECIAVVIDDAWAIASKTCRLYKGVKINRTVYTVKEANTSNFRVLSRKGKKSSDDVWSKVRSYELNNFFLLNAVNNNSNPLFSSDEKANITFTNTADINQFKSDFSDGIFNVNRTDKHTAGTTDTGDAYEDNFHPYYGVGRANYKKEIISLSKEANNTIATVSSTWIKPKLLRTGDPLFYIENGQKYLLGFGKAANLYDNFDATRTDKVVLLTNSDKDEIINKIKSVDPDSAARIEKDILVK